MALSLTRFKVRGRWRWAVRDSRGLFVGGAKRAAALSDIFGRVEVRRVKIRGRWRWQAWNPRTGRIVGGERARLARARKFGRKRKPPEPERWVEVPEVEVPSPVLFRWIGGYYGPAGPESPPGHYRLVLYSQTPVLLWNERRARRVLTEELDYFHLELANYRLGRAVAENLLAGGKWAGEEEVVDGLELPLLYGVGVVYVELVIRDYVYGWPSHAA